MRPTLPALNKNILPALFFLLLSACSSNGNTGDATQTTTATTRIEGTVVEQTSGEPVLNAVINTDPATEIVRTDSDGKFAISNGFSGPGNYRVFLEHDAYNNKQATISVGENDLSIVEFVLESSSIGLHASQSQIIFANDQNRETFRLSSNIQNTGYSILVSDPWVSVSPSSGVIANRETSIIEIRIDRDLLPQGQKIDSELVVNADNGTRELVLSIQINQKSSETSTPNTNNKTRQLDCRRVDLFRTGWKDPNAPLIQFLPSVQLPEQVGARTLSISNPFLADSFVVNELGTVVITHTGGDTDASAIELYELDLNENLVELASNYGTSAENPRASISYGIQPGIYCYTLFPRTGMFSNPENIRIEFGFIPAQ